MRREEEEKCELPRSPPVGGGLRIKFPSASARAECQVEVSCVNPLGPHSALQCHGNCCSQWEGELNLLCVQCGVSAVVSHPVIKEKKEWQRGQREKGRELRRNVNGEKKKKDGENCNREMGSGF